MVRRKPGRFSAALRCPGAGCRTGPRAGNAPRTRRTPRSTRPRPSRCAGRHRSRCPHHDAGGTPPICSVTSIRPWHRHSAFSPGSATLFFYGRMFEYGSRDRRQCTSAISQRWARATPRVTAHAARRPLDRTCPSRWHAAVRLAPPVHVTHRGQILAVVIVSASRRSCTAPDRVPLLLGGNDEALQPLVRRMRVRVDLRPVHAIAFQPGGNPPYPRTSRLSRDHVKTPRYLRATFLPVESPDILHNGHRYRHISFPSRAPAGILAESRPIGNSGIYRPRHRASHHRKRWRHRENHQPTLRKNTAEPVEPTLKQNTIFVTQPFVDAGSRCRHARAPGLPVLA